MREAQPTAVVVSGRGLPSAALRAALAAAGLRAVASTPTRLLTARSLVPPALVVLESISGPDDVLDVQARLRSRPGLHRVPILVLSEDCSIDTFGGAIARGASAFVRSPPDESELEDAVRRLAAWSARAGGAVRRVPRRPLLLGADVDVPGLGPVRGRIVDVSAGGARLELPAPVAEGVTLGIVPRSCDDSTEIRLAGVVRWSKPAAEGHSVAVRWPGTVALVARRLFGLRLPARARDETPARLPT